MSIIRIIIIAAAVYYLIKILLRLIMPFVIKKMFDKLHQNMQGGNNNWNANDGEVTVNQKRKEKVKDNYGGEYVEFEEIKE